MKRTLLLTIALLVAMLTQLNGQNWAQTAQFDSPFREELGEFGRSVSISGNYAIVGAITETTDTLGLNSLVFPGAAYIYKKNAAGNWVFSQKLIASDRSDGDRFGTAVAIDGEYAIVGSACQDLDAQGNNFIVNTGAVYIFKRDANDHWAQVQKIVSTDRNFEDWFGEAVAISGNNILVAARGDDYDPTNTYYVNGAGAAYIFVKDSSNVWVQQQKIVASDRTKDAQFGWAVSIDGNLALIGAPDDSLDANAGNPLHSCGSAYVFELTNGYWIQQDKLTASDREEEAAFGGSVSISNGTIVVGASHQGGGPFTIPPNPFYQAGAAYVFGPGAEGHWFETQKLVAPIRHTNDLFGCAVAVSFNKIVIGTLGDDFDANGVNYLMTSGAAFVFDQGSNGIWYDTQKLVASNRTAKDAFARSISMDGNDILVGVPGRCLDTANTDSLKWAGAVYFFSGCNKVETLNVTACNNYIWMGTTYTQSCSPFHVFPLTQGCDSIVNLNLDIRYIDLTVTQGTYPNNNILSAPLADHYQWLDCANGYTKLIGDTFQVFTGQPGGMYAVELTSNGCSDTSACIPVTVGMAHYPFDETIKVYPNPSSGQLHIDLGSNCHTGLVRITDLLGRTVGSYPISEQHFVDLNLDQTRGAYTLEIFVDGRYARTKVIKE